jgi:hypothetical protein
MSLITPIPNSPFYSDPSYSVNTQQGTLILGSGLSVTPDGTLLVASALGGTVSQVTAGTGLSGGTITDIGTINLVPATNVSLGGIKVGANLTIAPDGTLSALPPGTGTISGVIAGNGLQGGGLSGIVTLSIQAASTTQIGGVSVVPTGGLDIVGGALSLTTATQTQKGGVTLATAAEVITGTDPNKAVTPATLAAKTATTLRPGIVQLSDSVAIADSTKAATQTAARTAYVAATNAQATADAALPKAGGVMTGVITFAPSQTFPGVAFPVATANSLGVISAGPGLQVNTSGVLSTVNNGTVTAVTAGPGLGTPGSGGTISTFGTIRLLPPTTDGIQLGGVKAGANIAIAYDGTISVPGTAFIASNNEYAYNSYIWPAPNAPGPGPIPLPLCPGLTGQVLTIASDVTGQLAWTSTGTLSQVISPVGSGITVSSTPTTASISLSPVPSISPGDYGATALIPTFTINQYGQIISSGQANPFAPFETPTVTAPFELVLDFTGNSTNWEWILNGNTVIKNPVNAVPGQTGHLLISQAPLTSGPFSITWDSSWKFGNFTPYGGNPTSAAVDMIQFTVVSANYIVVTNIIENIG